MSHTDVPGTTRRSVRISAENPSASPDNRDISQKGPARIWSSEEPWPNRLLPTGGMQTAAE